MSPPSTPCGPTKEGDLMFRPHTYQHLHPNAPTNPWEAGYFVLKGGVVYMFTDSNQRLPKRAIPLKGGLCQGCRRIPNSHRPHTFEILLKPNKSYQFAAPDEYVASEWLQSFVQSASGLFDCTENKEPKPCSLITTTKHLVAMKEIHPGTQRGQTLSCASIKDLAAFRVPLVQQSWCILVSTYQSEYMIQTVTQFHVLLKYIFKNVYNFVHYCRNSHVEKYMKVVAIGSYISRITPNSVRLKRFWKHYGLMQTWYDIIILY